MNVLVAARGLRVMGLLCLLLLVSACATPIGVARVDTQSVYRSLTASVLSTGRPSAATEQVLVRNGLAQRFQDDPEATLAALRGSGVGLSHDRLFALAELSFVQAEATPQPTATPIGVSRCTRDRSSVTASRVTPQSTALRRNASRGP